MDYSRPCASVHAILQARILEWITMPSPRGSSWPRDRSCILSCIAGEFFTSAPPGKPVNQPYLTNTCLKEAHVKSRVLSYYFFSSPWFPLELVEHSWASLLHWDPRSRHPTWSLRETRRTKLILSPTHLSTLLCPTLPPASCFQLSAPTGSPGRCGGERVLTRVERDEAQLGPPAGASARSLPPGVTVCPPAGLCSPASLQWPRVSMSLPSQPAVYPWSQFAFLAPDPSVGPNFKCYQALLSSSPLCPDRLNRPSSPHKHRRRGQFMWSIEWLRRKEVAFISFLKKQVTCLTCIDQPFDLIDSSVLTVNPIELGKQMGKSQEFKASHPSFLLIWEWGKLLPKKWRLQARAVNRPSLFHETVVFEDT